MTCELSPILGVSQYYIRCIIYFPSYNVTTLYIYIYIYIYRVLSYFYVFDNMTIQLLLPLLLKCQNCLIPLEALSEQMWCTYMQIYAIPFMPLEKYAQMQKEQWCRRNCEWQICTNRKRCQSDVKSSEKGLHMLLYILLFG